MSEPGAGSDAIGSMATRAVRRGDHYVLNGTKLWITNGPVADVVLVYAKTSPEKGNQGVSAFLVEKGMAGFSVGKKQDKSARRTSPTLEPRNPRTPDAMRAPLAARVHPQSPRLLPRVNLPLGPFGVQRACV